MKLSEFLIQTGVPHYLEGDVYDVEEFDQEVTIFAGNQLRPNTLYQIHSIQNNGRGPVLVVGDVVS